MNPDLVKDNPFPASLFQARVGETFRIEAEDGTPVDLVLKECEIHVRQESKYGLQFNNPWHEDRPYALVFEGPGDIPLTQRLYTFRHPELEDLVFSMTPISNLVNGVRYYESVFN